MNSFRFHRAVGLIALTLTLVSASAFAKSPQIVTLDAPSPLIEIRLMLRSGSAHDPAGKEGLAAITADAILEGSFQTADGVVTKEQLAQITQPWGSGAAPGVLSGKEATTFVMTVPKDLLETYIETVLRPMLTKPMFDEAEIERLCNEATTSITGFLRYENLEMLGLSAIDNWVFEGGPLGHAVGGSVEGLANITREDVLRFYATHYKTEKAILGLSTTDRSVIDSVSKALEGLGQVEGRVRPWPVKAAAAPEMPEGRHLTVVKVPDSGSTGIHMGFPISITREDDDFWPLYVANVYFGTHRDSHGNLYQRIRQERGYNYGNYSYIEHFAWRPFNLFPPFNTVRSQQYFSIWVRPVGNEFAHHIAKAVVFELEDLMRNGISDRDIELAKNKAKVLYLNLAETSSRLLAAKMDDAFYGMDPGYLEGYLERIDAVTAEQANAALQKYLQAGNFKMLIAAEAAGADALAEDIKANRNAQGKTLADYQVESIDQDGATVWQLPESRLETIKRDGAWENTWLGFDPANIRVVPVEALFQTGEFIADLKAAASR